MLGKFFKAIFEVAVELPIAVVKDIATIGGSATGEKETYTEQKIEEITDDLDEVL